MSHTQHQLADHPARYRITVQGRLDARWTDYCDGLTLIVHDPPGAVPTTTLTGCMTDQAALHGLLQLLHGLGLVLLAVQRIEPGAPLADEQDSGADTRHERREEDVRP